MASSIGSFLICLFAMLCLSAGLDFVGCDEYPLLIVVCGKSKATGFLFNQGEAFSSSAATITTMECKVGDHFCKLETSVAPGEDKHAAALLNVHSHLHEVTTSPAMLLAVKTNVDIIERAAKLSFTNHSQAAFEGLLNCGASLEECAFSVPGFGESAAEKLEVSVKMRRFETPAISFSGGDKTPAVCDYAIFNMCLVHGDAAEEYIKAASRDGTVDGILSAVNFIAGMRSAVLEKYAKDLPAGSAPGVGDEVEVKEGGKESAVPDGASGGGNPGPSDGKPDEDAD